MIRREIIYRFGHLFGKLSDRIISEDAGVSHRAVQLARKEYENNPVLSNYELLSRWKR